MFKGKINTVAMLQSRDVLLLLPPRDLLLRPVADGLLVLQLERLLERCHLVLGVPADRGHALLGAAPPNLLAGSRVPVLVAALLQVTSHFDRMLRLCFQQRLCGKEPEIELQSSGDATNNSNRMLKAELLQLWGERVLFVLKVNTWGGW